MEVHVNSTYHLKGICLFILLRNIIPTVCENLPQQYSKGPDIRVNCVGQICQGLRGHPSDLTVNLGGGRVNCE